MVEGVPGTKHPFAPLPCELRPSPCILEILVTAQVTGVTSWRAGFKGVTLLACSTHRPLHFRQRSSKLKSLPLGPQDKTVARSRWEGVNFVGMVTFLSPFSTPLHEKIPLTSNHSTPYPIKPLFIYRLYKSFSSLLFPERALECQSTALIPALPSLCPPGGPESLLPRV